MRRHFLSFFLFLLSFILYPLSLFAGWELVRSLSASCGLVEAEVNGFVVSQAIGDNLSSPSPLTFPAGTIITGYLSQIPSGSLVPSVTTIKSSGAVLSGGILWGVRIDDYFKVAFSNDVLPESLQSKIYVTEILDNAFHEVNSTCSVNIAYFGEDRAAGIIPDLSTWKKGYFYAVYLSSGVTDANGLVLSKGTTVYFNTVRDYSKNNVINIVQEPQIGISVPANAYKEDFFLAISTSQNIESIQTANQKIKLLPEKITDLLKIMNVLSMNNQGIEIQPNSACTLKLPYQDDNNDGILDNISPHMRVKDLAVWRLNDAKSLWVKQNGESINTGSKTISLNVPHFSSYALFGQSSTDVSSVFVYPVPFRPNSNNPGRYGTWAELITFTNLPSFGNIRIYTVSGELVREININAPEMKWNVKNSGGETVASGVYIWEVVSGPNRKTGKLMVIK